MMPTSIKKPIIPKNKNAFSVGLLGMFKYCGFGTAAIDIHATSKKNLKFNIVS